MKALLVIIIVVVVFLILRLVKKLILPLVKKAKQARNQLPERSTQNDSIEYIADTVNIEVETTQERKATLDEQISAAKQPVPDEKKGDSARVIDERVPSSSKKVENGLTH